MRDDIGKLKLPASAKRYARMHGVRAITGDKKQKLYTQMVADLVNRGQTAGFRNVDAVGQVRMASPMAKKLAGRRR